MAVAQALFTFEQVAAGQEQLQYMVNLNFSITEEHLNNMRDFLSWPEDGQKNYMSRFSAEQLGLMLLTEQHYHARNSVAPVEHQPAQVQSTQQRQNAYQIQQPQQMQNFQQVQNAAQLQRVQPSPRAQQAHPVQQFQTELKANASQARCGSYSTGFTSGSSSQQPIDLDTPPTRHQLEDPSSPAESSLFVSPALENAQIGMPMMAQNLQQQLSVQSTPQIAYQPQQNQNFDMAPQHTFAQQNGLQVPFQQFQQMPPSGQMQNGAQYPAVQGFQPQPIMMQNIQNNSHIFGIQHGALHQSPAHNVPMGLQNGQFFQQQQVQQNAQPNLNQVFQAMLGQQMGPNMNAPYQQQIMVNGQLMTVTLQNAQGQQQGQVQMANIPTNYNNQGNMGGYRKTKQQPRPQNTNANAVMDAAVFSMPDLTHDMKVVQERAKSAAWRQKQGELRANGLEPMKLADHSVKGPPLLLGGPGLGNLPQGLQNLPAMQASNGDGQNGSIQNAATPRPYVNQTVLPPHVIQNYLNAQQQARNGFQQQMQMNVPATPVQNNIGYVPQNHLVNGQWVNAYGIPISQPQPKMIQMPNAAGQISLGPNAQGSTSPAGQGNGNTKPSPSRRRATPKKSPKNASTVVTSNAVAVNGPNGQVYQSPYSQAPVPMAFGNGGPHSETTDYKACADAYHASNGQYQASVQAMPPPSNANVQQASNGSFGMQTPVPSPSAARVARPSSSFVTNQQASAATSTPTAMVPTPAIATPAAPVVPSPPTLPRPVVLSGLTMPRSNMRLNYEIITPEEAARRAAVAATSASTIPSSTVAEPEEESREDLEVRMRQGLLREVLQREAAADVARRNENAVEEEVESVWRGEEGVDDIMDPLFPIDEE